MNDPIKNIKRILVLDAMGVIYKACDDVEELLIPFVHEMNPGIDPDCIKNHYIKASLGELSNEAFWESLELSHIHLDAYLSRHSLSDSLFDEIRSIRNLFDCCICLSNDVSEWSLALRNKFDLYSLISDWFISGDIHARKPSNEIYEAVEIKFGPNSQFFFLDDNPKNVIAAQNRGWNAYLFNKNRSLPIYDDKFKSINSFRELEQILVNS